MLYLEISGQQCVDKVDSLQNADFFLTTTHPRMQMFTRKYFAETQVGNL